MNNVVVKDNTYIWFSSSDILNNNTPTLLSMYSPLFLDAYEGNTPVYFQGGGGGGSFGALTVDGWVEMLQ